MQDLFTITLIWLAILAAMIGGFIWYRRRGKASSPTSTNGAEPFDPDAAMPPHRLQRIKGGDAQPQTPPEA